MAFPLSCTFVLGYWWQVVFNPAPFFINIYWYLINIIMDKTLGDPHLKHYFVKQVISFAKDCRNRLYFNRFSLRPIKGCDLVCYPLKQYFLFKCTLYEPLYITFLNYHFFPLNLQSINKMYKLFTKYIPFNPPFSFYLQKQMRSRSKWCFSTLVNNIFILPCRQWSGFIGEMYNKSREWACTSGKFKKNAFLSVGEYYHCSITEHSRENSAENLPTFYPILNILFAFVLFLHCGSIDFPFCWYCWG